jgi:tetratricopeptide (TPR) repeat protein
VQQPIPESPKTQFGTAMEGWVKVRYSVLANGTTANVRVVDFMPPRLDTRATVAAVEKWTFQPAAADAQSSEWHNEESTIVFDDAALPLEPSPMFTQGYVAARELLSQNDFEKARDAANQRLLMFASRLNEIGLAETQLALASIGLSDYHSAYAAILRATDPTVVTLTDDELRRALEARFEIELQLGRAADARTTYNRYRPLLPADGSTADALNARAQLLDKALQGDAAIAVKGRVDREAWAHVPSRRTFTIAAVEGEVREIQVECDRRKTVLPYQAEVDWTLPPGWGECTLFVEAKRDTTFTLYEFK